MGLLPEVCNSNNYIQALAQHLPMETIKESTIHTIQIGRNSIQAIQFKEMFNMLLIYCRLSTYFFPDSSSNGCMCINLLK